LQYQTFVKDILPRTRDVKSFRFSRPAELEFKPGQYLLLTVSDQGKELSKSFTISSSPTVPDYLEITKRITGSRFSAILDSFQMGDVVKIDAPHGNFIFDGGYTKIAALTGGIGITPLMSICKYCTDVKAKTSIVLLYSNHCADNVPFKQELDALQSGNKNLKVVFTITGMGTTAEQGSYLGRIKPEMVRREIPDYYERLFFVSGPPPMVESMTDLLLSMGIPEGQIKREEFSGYAEAAP